VTADAQRYLRLIQCIFLSCKVQPEEDTKESGKRFQSEAIMYDLVMTIATEGLGRAIKATEDSL